MAIAAITKQGLWTIAILVVILWRCLVTERLTVRKANLEMGQALREMGQRQIKVRHTTPAWLRRVRPAES